jgi:hypothetical protein
MLLNRAILKGSPFVSLWRKLNVIIINSTRASLSSSSILHEPHCQHHQFHDAAAGTPHYHHHQIYCSSVTMHYHPTLFLVFLFQSMYQSFTPDPSATNVQQISPSCNIRPGTSNQSVLHAATYQEQSICPSHNTRSLPLAKSFHLVGPSRNISLIIP